MAGSEHLQERRHLMSLVARMRKELPGPVGAFGELNKQATADGALSRKQKELMALAIGIAVRCNGCIDAHMDDALRAGASRAEVLETIGVAIMMGGGPSAVYGAIAYEALNQFSARERE